MSTEARKAAARARARAWYAANKERALAAGAAYREAHRDDLRGYFRIYNAAHAPQRAEAFRAYRERNGDALRAKARERYSANPQPYVNRARAWAAANPTKAKAHTTRKNHRRRGAEPDADAREYVEVLRRDPCCYCGTTADEIVIDHIHPVSLGGAGDAENLTAACRRCNASKSGKTLLQFLWERRPA